MTRDDRAAGSVTTLVERKDAEAARRRRAADGVVEALRAYARQEGGHFVVFGSYVADVMRFDSDLDVMIDFPAERAADAWNVAEEVCAEHRITPDLHDALTSSPALVARVRATGLVLP